MPVRVFGYIAFLGALTAALPANSQVRLAVANPELIPYTAQTAPASRQETLLKEVLKQITARKTRTKSEDLQRRLDQLGSLYSQPAATTFWTSDEGEMPNMSLVQDEFDNADYWGLNPDAFAYTPPADIIDGDMTALAGVEIGFSLVVLRYAEHAFGGRVDPTKLSLWLNRGPRPVDAMTFIPELATSANPAQLLQNLHPKHPQFSVLLNAYRQRKFPELHPIRKDDSDLIIPSGPKIKKGATHPQIGLIRRRLGVPPALGTDVYDKRLANAVAKIMKNKRWKYRKTTIDKWVRRALNEGPKKKQQQLKSISLRKLVIKMDRWRRMPDDLGRLHIRNNLPAYETQVFKGDSVIHKERIIIGKPNTQTPVFSDRMDYVVFKPNWGVPASIKIRQLLPRLRGGDYSVLSRRGMRIIGQSGRTISPRRFKWSRVNIADVPIFQAPGRSNPLGQVKFIFPNRHSVYMHDTPKKSLFKSRARSFSHGCIRVRNPKRLAEVIFSETKGWDKKQVHAHWSRKAKANKRVDLEQKIRVHNTYFTLVVTDDGKIESYKDVYGHDRRIGRAMDGVSAKKIAYSDPARLQKNQLKKLAKSGYTIKRNSKRSRRARSQRGTTHASNFVDPYAPKPLSKKKAAYYKKWKPKKYKYRRYVPMHRRYNAWSAF